MKVKFDGPAGYKHEKFLQLIMDSYTTETLGKLLLYAKLKEVRYSKLDQVRVQFTEEVNLRLNVELNPNDEKSVQSILDRSPFHTEWPSLIMSASAEENTNKSLTITTDRGKPCTWVQSRAAYRRIFILATPAVTI